MSPHRREAFIPFTLVCKSTASLIDGVLTLIKIGEKGPNNEVTPVLVSHVAITAYAMSRPHGNFIPDGNPLPAEYPQHSMYVLVLERIADNLQRFSESKLTFQCKMHWAFESEVEDEYSFGTLMKVGAELALLLYHALTFRRPSNPRWQVPSKQHLGTRLTITSLFAVTGTNRMRMTSTTSSTPLSPRIISPLAISPSSNLTIIPTHGLKMP